MTRHADIRRSFGPPLPDEARSAIRWICTNNPFYVISAGLFLTGMWISFGDPREAESTWALMCGLVGYTLLLAMTACMLVRFAKIWDDARTVLLLVVLMVLATSATFDRVLIDGLIAGQPGRGIVYFGVGLVFAVVVSEGLLRGIRLSLPALYRVPYYLILSLFFLYPPALTYLNLRDPHNEAVQWGLFGFASVASLVFLTLLPAIRRGAVGIADNGSPWPWPLYPWALFGLLALAVPGRAILLCYSMHLIDVADPYTTIFGPYFLVPFGLAIAILLLEMGLMSERGAVVKTALVLPAALVLLALIGHHTDRTYVEFLQVFRGRLGAGPAYVGLVAAAFFYAYASLRRTDGALKAMTCALVVLALSGRNSIRLEGFEPFQQVPLLLAATLHLGLGAWRRDSWHCWTGSLLGIASVALPGEVETLRLRIFLCSQLALIAFLIIGALFDDPLGRTLRDSGTLVAMLSCLSAILAPSIWPREIPPWAVSAYSPAMAVLLCGHGWLFRHRPSFVFAGAIVGLWVGKSGWQTYTLCRRMITGLDYLVVSLAMFALALLVSLGKAGLLPRWTKINRREAPQTPE